MNSSQDDEWDTDGYVIPSFTIDHPTPAETAKPVSPKALIEDLEPSSDPSATGRKQKLKHKLKEADKRSSGSGPENKLENLRELVGAQNSISTMAKSSPKDWLDPHCNESEFERRQSQ